MKERQPKDTNKQRKNNKKNEKKSKKYQRKKKVTWKCLKKEKEKWQKTKI